MTWRPDESDDKEIPSFYGAMSDITESEKLQDEKDLVTKEAQDLYENAPCGYYGINSDGEFTKINKTLLKWLQYKSEELLGQNISVIHTPESMLEWKNLRNSFTENGNIENKIETYIRKDGSTFPVILNSNIIQDKNGDILNTRSMVTDISDRIKYEEEISKSLKEKEILLKDIHHRVKNNLQIVSSMLFIQARKIDNQDAKNVLIESQNRINSIALLHEKLYMSKSLSLVDYDDYLKRVIDQFISTWAKKLEKIELEIDAKGVMLNSEQAIPCSLIINEIITNSMKYAFPDANSGKITIKCTQDEDHTVLECFDNGIGFQKVDKPKTKSLCLGIDLIKGFTEQLNGKIEFSSDNGTYYRIEFENKH